MDTLSEADHLSKGGDLGVLLSSLHLQRAFGRGHAWFVPLVQSICALLLAQQDISHPHSPALQDMVANSFHTSMSEASGAHLLARMRHKTAIACQSCVRSAATRWPLGGKNGTHPPWWSALIHSL